MNVLILGGTRFLGPPIVRELVDEGHNVCIFHRGTTEPDLPAAKHVHGDFADFKQYLPELHRFAPEVVIDVVPYEDKGGHGVLHFGSVAERVVLVTSMDVYLAFSRLHDGGSPEPLPLTEASSLRSDPSPDLGKEIDYDNVEIERAVRDRSEIPVTVLRMPAIYGPNDPLRRLRRYAKRMRDNRPVILLDERIADWRFSREYVANCAHAVALAATNRVAAGEIFNVAPAITLTEREWVESLAAVACWPGEIVVAPPENLPESVRAPFAPGQDVVVDGAYIRRSLGYEERVMPAIGLRAAIEWEQAFEASEGATLDYSDEDKALQTLSEQRT